MSESLEQQWIIKLEDGRIVGPYSTTKVLNKIGSGVYSGSEFISKYPGGEWISISSRPEFYDQLLLALSGSIVEVEPIDDSKEIADSAFHIKEVKSASAEMTDKTFDSTHKSNLDPASISELEMEKTRVLSDHESRVTLPDLTAATKTTESRRPADAEDIELVDIRNEKLKAIKAKAKLPLTIIAVLVFAGVAISFVPSNDSKGGFSLKRIRFENAEKLEPQALKSRIQNAIALYLRDTRDSYRAAESQLTEVIPSDPKNMNLYGILCLTQYELWPSARQSSADIETIDQVVRASSSVNPTDIYTATCKTASLMLKGKVAEAADLVEQTLTSFRGAKVSPIPFYYFKAILLENARDYQTAVGYANSARTLWPQWLRAYILEASLHVKMGDYTAAYEILSTIYKTNQNHPTTKTMLGIIEYVQFAKLDRARAFLKSGLKDADQLPRDIAAEGFIALANINMKENNSREALAAAQSALRFDPSNQTTKNLILRLGGKQSLTATSIKAHELMLEGDQFVRQGDCQAAQAHYKSAFDIDPKLGTAAYKAGKCLWEVSFSTEAIQWMKKAIQADPRLIDGYIALADFYSQRFDFLSAAQVLNAASRVTAKSHKVYRGYAMVELRRMNTKTAISYAKQSLLIYPNDVESLIILSEAYLLSGTGVQEAFASAAKAIEIEPSNKKAQIVYAKSIAKLQGADFGIEHLREQILRYPLASEYRLALGNIYLVDERFADAEGVFRQLVDIQEKPKKPLMQLGRVLKFQSRYQEAIDTFFRAAVFDPSDAEPFFEAGKLLLEFKKPKDAKKQFERVLLTNSKYPLIHYQIGRADLQMKNPKAALEQAEKEKLSNPNLPDAYKLSADAHSRLKQYSLCAQEYQQAIKLEPSSTDSYIKAASCYRLSGSLDSADSMLKIASRQESGNPLIYREQGALFEARGDFEKAIAAYREYFILDPNAPDRALIEKRIQGFSR